MSRSSWRASVRIALLALVALAAGSAAVSLAPAQPLVRRHHPTQLAAAAERCRTAAPAASTQLDARLARLVAPTRTVVLRTPLRVLPALSLRHVFPVAAAISVADTFGAARADTGWHHGDDLFAARGTPVVAVADGVLFSVGWQRLGGRRLWLRDEAGNEFYYAHLNRYAARVRDGREVRAGDLLGFVGNSGDAEQTPPHLHFEIHPASLLGLGYDGAVDPTRYLRAWPHVGAQPIAREPKPPQQSCPAAASALAKR